MASKTSVVLYGKSVFMAGIKAQLERDPDIALITLQFGSKEVNEKIRDIKPNAFIFDLSEGQPNFAIPLLREQPGLRLIGVDPSSDEVLVMSCHLVQALSMADLLAVIHQKNIHPTEQIPK